MLKAHKSQIKSNINKINRINTTKPVANVQWTLGQIFGQHICQYLPTAWDYVENQITHRHYIDSTVINEHQTSIYLTTEYFIVIQQTKELAQKPMQFASAMHKAGSGMECLARHGGLAATSATKHNVICNYESITYLHLVNFLVSVCLFAPY